MFSQKICPSPAKLLDLKEEVAEGIPMACIR